MGKKLKSNTLKRKSDSQSSVKTKKTRSNKSSENHIKSSKTVKNHKTQLERLKQKDPEFYKFLEKEDKDILAFSSDSEVSENSDSESAKHQIHDLDSADDSDSESNVHVPPEKLEEVSDSDSELEENSKVTVSQAKKKCVVTSKMVASWEESLQSDESSIAALHSLSMAFRAAIRETGSDEVQDSKYKVEGSSMFNSVIRACLKNIYPALSKILKLHRSKKSDKIIQPTESKKWSKVRFDIRNYLTDVIYLLDQFSDSEVVSAILRHVLLLVPFYCCFPKLNRNLLKKMIVLWSSAEETPRVLSFFVINQVIRSQPTLLDSVTKSMYMTYVRNCKFTSPSSLPMINFMSRCLTEVLGRDTEQAYGYMFVYIRQLAIHLRNAITIPKKENSQAVYNWQYIHSLSLWTLVLTTLNNDEFLKPLIYPLVQTIIGTIKLIPTSKYLPLRFHCVRLLTQIMQKTDTFIPTLPFLLEVFDLVDFNKKYTATSFKPFNFACILKFSKAQLKEKAFKDGVMEQLYDSFLEHAYAQAHTISFPEVFMPTILQLKRFIKVCKVANYTKQIKQLLEKIEENARIIEQRRRKSTLNLRDTQQVDAWERHCQSETTPLMRYYTSWRKLRDSELQKEISCKDQMAPDNIPKIERPKGPLKATKSEKDEFSSLFNSDDESAEDGERFLLKSERSKKKQNKDSEEEYSDFDEDELEQLAKSASEDDSDEEDSNEDNDDGDENDDSLADDSEEYDETEEQDNEDTDDSENDDADSDQEDIVENLEISDDSD